MRYKTTVKINNIQINNASKDYISIEDGAALSQENDLIVALHLLHDVINNLEKKNKSFKKDTDFQITEIGTMTFFDISRFKVTITESFINDVIEVVEKNYPGLAIEGLYDFRQRQQEKEVVNGKAEKTQGPG